MTVPVRMQAKRAKGFELQVASRELNGLDCIYVGRPTKWGNPYKVGTAATPTAAAAVLRYRERISENPQTMAQIDRELRGKNLACWCSLASPCHADVLLEIANAPPRKEAPIEHSDGDALPRKRR